MEGPPKTKSENKESIKNPKHHVEDVVEDVRIVHDACLRDPTSRKCVEANLHTEIEDSEIGEVFRNYAEHKILSLTDITHSIQNTVAHLENELSKLAEGSEDYRFAYDKCQLIRKRAEEIRKGVQRYVRTLSHFFQLNKQKLRLDPEDYKDKLQDIDRRRRINHDALIQTLRVYSEVVYALREYGFLEDQKIIAWDYSTELLNIESEKDIVIFSPKILENRDLVKDWAISAHLYEQLHQIEQIKENGTTSSSA